MRKYKGKAKERGENLRPYTMCHIDCPIIFPVSVSFFRSEVVVSGLYFSRIFNVGNNCNILD